MVFHRSPTTGKVSFTDSMRSGESCRVTYGVAAEPDVLLDRHLPEHAVPLQHMGQAARPAVAAGCVR